MAAQELADDHVHDRIDEFLAGRLDSEAETEFEAHLLACDACFAAYLARTIPEL